MSKHLKYLKYVLTHKWYVLLKCIELGIPWRGIVHDLSKFLPSEWSPYVEYFYGDIHKFKSPDGKHVAGDRFVMHAGGLSDYVESHDDGDYVVRRCIEEETRVLDKDNVEIYSCVTYYLELVPLTVYNAFNAAWNRHAKRNPHHWQYWLLTKDDCSSTTIEMPNEYVLEMIADWAGASLAQGYNDTTDLYDWYAKRRDRFEKLIHPHTLAAIDEYMT
jgi:hypothetical protein